MTTRNLEELEAKLYEDFDNVRHKATLPYSADVTAQFRIAEAQIAANIIAIEKGKKPWKDPGPAPEV